VTRFARSVVSSFQRAVRRAGPPRALAVAGALGVVTAFGVACSVLIGDEADQCTRDADCGRFGNFVCDVGARVCIAAGDRTARPVDGGNDGPSDDGALDAAPDAPLSPCARVDKPRIVVRGAIAESTAWSCVNDYVLEGVVRVETGATLTIEKGTQVFGDTTSPGGLVIAAGARIVADGTRDEPIVFTSARPPSQRQPGDWIGVALIGRARMNAQAQNTPLGITTSGGSEDTSDSGILRYVRIEYASSVGLSFFAVGSATVVDYVQVRQTRADCFSWFGGTVNAKHLVCTRGGDDGFDYNFGYRGKLQFLVFQATPDLAARGTSGVVGDSNGANGNAVPISEPYIYNGTFCGRNRENLAEVDYGVLLGTGTRGQFRNIIVTGFMAGVDVFGVTTAANATNRLLTFRHTLFSNNRPVPIAYAETGDGGAPPELRDDDNGFDEVAWFLAPENRNAVRENLGLGDCFALRNPEFRPSVALVDEAEAPPDDGFFDPTAKFVGAFRDTRDTWATGNWVVLDGP
jgi:hypothetical protein